jgi:hypothetical protein
MATPFSRIHRTSPPGSLFGLAMVSLPPKNFFWPILHHATSAVRHLAGSKRKKSGTGRPAQKRIDAVAAVV